MGTAFKVNLGINDLKMQLAQIDQYDQATQEKLRSAVRTATDHIFVGAKRRVPVRSGNLTKKISMSYDSTKNVGIVRVKSPVAHLVEYGAKSVIETHKRKKALHGGRLVGFANKVHIPIRKEHPFLRPAFEDERPILMRSVEDAIKP